eukprot:m51a1_g7141 hypothetical protein (601) ;mRNA; f:293324-295689
MATSEDVAHHKALLQDCFQILKQLETTKKRDEERPALPTSVSAGSLTVSSARPSSPKRPAASVAPPASSGRSGSIEVAARSSAAAAVGSPRSPLLERHSPTTSPRAAMVSSPALSRADLALQLDTSPELSVRDRSVSSSAGPATSAAGAVSAMLDAAPLAGVPYDSVLACPHCRQVFRLLAAHVVSRPAAAAAAAGASSASSAGPAQGLGGGKQRNASDIRATLVEKMREAEQRDQERSAAAAAGGGLIAQPYATLRVRTSPTQARGALARQQSVMQRNFFEQQQHRPSAAAAAAAAAAVGTPAGASAVATAAAAQERARGAAVGTSTPKMEERKSSRDPEDPQGKRTSFGAALAEMSLAQCRDFIRQMKDGLHEGDAAQLTPKKTPALDPSPPPAAELDKRDREREKEREKEREREREREKEREHTKDIYEGIRAETLDEWLAEVGQRKKTDVQQYAQALADAGVTLERIRAEGLHAESLGAMGVKSATHRKVLASAAKTARRERSGRERGAHGHRKAGSVDEDAKAALLREVVQQRDSEGEPVAFDLGDLDLVSRLNDLERARGPAAGAGAAPAGADEGQAATATTPHGVVTAHRPTQ